MRYLGAAAIVFLLGAIATAQDDVVRRQLLPTGKLRVGINTNNQLTRVVGAELGRELARRLGVEAVNIDYPTPGAVTEAVGKEWDVAFVAADPDRAGAIAFTPPYVQLDVTYLVAGASRFKATADVHRPGVRIATGATSAYTLFLKREVRGPELVFMTTDDAAKALQAGSVDAIAGLRFSLAATASRVPGSRLLPDDFTRAEQAIALPKANTAALDYVTRFVGEMIRTGFVAGAVQRTGLTGASVPAS